MFRKVANALNNRNTLGDLIELSSLPGCVFKDLKIGRSYLLDKLIYRPRDLEVVVVICDQYMQCQVLDTYHDHLLSGRQGCDETFDCVRSIEW